MLLPSIRARLLFGMQQMPEQDLEKVIGENVQIGTSPQRVVDFLNGRHLEHTNLERLGQYDSDSRYYPVGTLMIRAIKRHTASGVFGFQSLQIIFVFGENHELVRFDVKPVYTAP
jgi:hypothetical protein